MEVQARTAADHAPGPMDKIWAGRLLACVDDDGAGPVSAEWRLSLPACPDRIVELAHREGADMIVMVGQPLGSLRRRIVGTWACASFAGRVADLSDRPVVVLKQATVQ